MRRPLALSLLLCAPVLHATAQDADEPIVFLTFYGGFSTGQHLWQVNQPLCVWQTVIGGYQCESGPSGTVNDTLTLSRHISTGWMAGIGMTRYFSRHLGGRVDLWFADESIADACSAPGGFQPDSDQKNLQTCTHFTADHQSLSSVGLAASALLRPFPSGQFSPYLRAGAGLVIPTGETLSASGDFFANGRSLDRQMVVDSSGQGLRPYGVLAVGLQTGAGPTSRFQVEVSDALVPVDRITGPANSNGQAPHSRSLRHNFSATMGISLVLSGRRGHRY